MAVASLSACGGGGGGTDCGHGALGLPSSNPCVIRCDSWVNDVEPAQCCCSGQGCTRLQPDLAAVPARAVVKVGERFVVGSGHTNVSPSGCNTVLEQPPNLEHWALRPHARVDLAGELLRGTVRCGGTRDHDRGCGGCPNGFGRHRAHRADRVLSVVGAVRVPQSTPSPDRRRTMSSLIVEEGYLGSRPAELTLTKPSTIERCGSSPAFGRHVEARRIGANGRDRIGCPRSSRQCPGSANGVVRRRLPGVASCAYQVAIVLTVSSEPAGGPVENVSIRVARRALGPATCALGSAATTCTIAGEGGAYTITVDAPGFTSSQRSVTVRSTTGQCDCMMVRTENVALSLSRLP